VPKTTVKQDRLLLLSRRLAGVGVWVAVAMWVAIGAGYEWVGFLLLFWGFLSFVAVVLIGRALHRTGRTFDMFHWYSPRSEVFWLRVGAFVSGTCIMAAGTALIAGGN
jgi:hypothetical protein